MTVRDLIEPFLGPVSRATIAFPLAASVVAVPFALYHYRKHGRVHPWRAFVSYSFVYYLIAALFLVILPLPERPVGAAEVLEWSRRYSELTRPRLDPTGFVRDAIQAAPGGERARALAQIVFNVFLLLPFGSYLAYSFRRPLWAVPLYGLSLSLCFELCQLTGDFGLYPGPYRLFDTGDLVLNTGGAVIGGLLARLLARAGFLPRLEDLKGPQDPWVRPFRRLLAFGLDVAAFGLSTIVLVEAADLLWGVSDTIKGVVAAVVALFWFIIFPVVDRGRGLGKRLTFCAIRSSAGGSAGTLRVLARQAILWATPAVSFALVSVDRKLSSSIPLVALVALWLCFWVLNALKSTFGSEHAGYLDRWLGTRVRETWTETRAPPPRRRRGPRGKGEPGRARP